MASEIKKGDAEGLLRRAKSVAQEWRDMMQGAEKKQYSSRPTLRDFTSAIHRLEDAVSRYETGAPEQERVPYKNEAVVSRRGGSDDWEAEHESFGLIRFGRVTGSARLFGSHLEQHRHYIVMTVSRAKLCHGLSYDRHHPTNELIEVAMSAAQFAEVITSLNSGVGAPCTLLRVDGIRMESVPEEAQAEHRNIRDGFEKKIEHVTTALEEARDRFAEMLEGGAVKKSDAREVFSVVAKAAQELRHNAPFVVDQFRESADRVATSAKAEVEAFTAVVLRRAGMEALANGHVPQLTAPESDDD